MLQKLAFLSPDVIIIIIRNRASVASSQPDVCSSAHPPLTGCSRLHHCLFVLMLFCMLLLQIYGFLNTLFFSISPQFPLLEFESVHLHLNKIILIDTKFYKTFYYKMGIKWYLRNMLLVIAIKSFWTFSLLSWSH